MKDYAVAVTAYENAELLACERDETPLGPTEVAGTTLASLISAGTELASAYKGQNFPIWPGYAAIFRVDAIGSEVQNVQIGDRLFCMGPHRSYQRCLEAETAKLPDHVAPSDGVFARLMSVSMSTLSTTTARPPAKVIVVGLGPVGFLASQLFSACGYQVMACDPVASRREWASQHGIQTSAGLPLGDPDWQDKVSLVVECSGHEQATLDACRVVAKKGEVVLVGVPWKRHTELFAHELLHAVFHRYVVLRSGWEWELPHHPTEFRTGSIWENLEAALRWIGENKIPLEGLVSIHAPRDCQQAYQDLMLGQTQGLATVFDWTKL